MSALPPLSSSSSSQSSSSSSSSSLSTKYLSPASVFPKCIATPRHIKDAPYDDDKSPGTNQIGQIAPPSTPTPIQGADSSTPILQNCLMMLKPNAQQISSPQQSHKTINSKQNPNLKREQRKHQRSESETLSYCSSPTSANEDFQFFVMKEETSVVEDVSNN